jgi:lysophospholipase L1-like esterase
VLALSLPATLIACVLSAVLIEGWVRIRWDSKRGTPGFFLSDPVRGNRLAPGYEGWFAGVPVRINSLGFRDRRDYSVAKPPGTFRILILGDSVTFGHGTLDDTTYPYLVEQRLKQWRPDVNWEVWNLGVPGYNTSQELAYLQEAGPRYDPDLVIVGFYANDLVGNVLPLAPSLPRRLASATQRLMQQHLYSYELYKRIALTVRFRLMTSTADQARLNNLSDDDVLLSAGSDASQRDDQRLGDVDTFNEQDVAAFTCKGKPGNDANRDSLAVVVRERSPEIAAWIESVRALQQLARDKAYRLMFFINMAPPPCSEEDRFHDGGSLDDEASLREVMEDSSTPVAASTRAFLHYRPSQMPGANGHSFGNSNRVKADALFESLRSTVLPTLVPQAR